MDRITDVKMPGSVKLLALEHSLQAMMTNWVPDTQQDAAEAWLLHIMASPDATPAQKLAFLQGMVRLGE